jgi:hypothetical protein
VVWLSPKHRRAIAQVVLAIVAGLVVSWLGMAALVVLSFAWPANQVPHVLLVVWLCAIVCDLALPGGWPRGDAGLGKRILFAPLGPPLRVAFPVWRALRH